MKTRPSLLAAAAAALLLAVPAGADPSDPPPRTLSDCIATALENNHLRPASRFAVQIAEAQHRQALSGYWPQLSVQTAYERTERAPDFLFPSTSIPVAPQTITTSASTALITVPAGVLGPTAVQLPVSIPSQSVTTPAQAITVPAQDVRLMNPTSEMGSVDLKWLLFDGGMRGGAVQQASGYVQAMREQSRRTDLEIVDQVTRYYYGAVLARQLRDLGDSTLERMSGTLTVTESLYKNGSGAVKRTDYLENKVMVETVRSMAAMLGKNEAMARAALANAMGLPWQASVAPADAQIAPADAPADPAALAGAAYEFSPDWKQWEAAVSSREGAVKSARGDLYPKVALTGQLRRWWNSYDAGLSTSVNKEGWSLGLGLEWPLFDGFLTRAKLAEARARLGELREQGILLKEGIGLQVKDLVLTLAALRASSDATAAARNAAVENCDLNTRAYQDGLVETEKVIRAQLIEALMSAQHCKTLYDMAEARSRLDLVVGSEVIRKLQAP